MIIKRLKNIIDNIDEDGCIGDNITNQSPFYTSLLILSVIEIFKIGNFDINMNIHKSILWLLRNQLKDGSWKETNALQIPKPDCLNPNSTNWVVSEFGYNIRAIEFNRLFTTSVCLKAIYEFKKGN